MKCPKCGFNSFEYLNNCKRCGNALDAFKESLGLRPLVLAPDLAGDVPNVQPSPEPKPDQAPFGTEAADETFQWDTPVAAATSGQTESEYEEFNLNLEESEPAPPSPAFSADEPPQLTPDLPQAQPAEDSLFGELSFGGPAEESHDPFSPDAFEQSPQAAVETGFGEFSFDDSQSELDPFATGQTVTDNPFGEVAVTATAATSDEELPFDPFGDIPPEELQQKSEPMATAAGELNLDDFLLRDETTAAIQEEEKKVSSTGAQMAIDELDSLFGEIESADKKR